MAYDSVIKSNFDLSIAEFDQYLSIYPEGRFVANAHYWKGQAYLYLNRYDEAMSVLEQAIECQPTNAKAYYTLGHLYDRKHMDEEAALMYKKAREYQSG